MYILVSTWKFNYMYKSLYHANSRNTFSYLLYLAQLNIKPLEFSQVMLNVKKTVEYSINIARQSYLVLWVVFQNFP